MKDIIDANELKETIKSLWYYTYLADTQATAIERQRKTIAVFILISKCLTFNV